MQICWLKIEFAEYHRLLFVLVIDTTTLLVPVMLLSFTQVIVREFTQHAKDGASVSSLLWGS